jgi:hypothetical protein
MSKGTTNMLVFLAVGLGVVFFDMVAGVWPVMFNDPISSGIFVFVNVGLGAALAIAALASKFGS